MNYNDFIQLKTIFKDLKLYSLTDKQYKDVCVFFIKDKSFIVKNSYLVPNKERIYVSLSELKKYRTKQLEKNKFEINSDFVLSAINIDCNYNVQKIVDGIKRFAFDLKNDCNKIKNICILLSGVSGVGKTQFAKYISNISQLPYKQVTASDILNSYVGETQKKIKRCFERATQNKEILIIDQIDSLLRERKIAEHNFQITMTNQFLVQMQNFKGILICTTNLLNIIDNAVSRRFMFKINFLSLTNQGKKILFDKYFGNQLAIDNNQFDSLYQLEDLRPCDFKNTRDRINVLYEEKLIFSQILEELNSEIKYRNQNFKNT